LSAGPEKPFKKSANAIEIVRLSLCDRARAASLAPNPFFSWRNLLALSIPLGSRGRALNLVDGSAVQWPEFATGYEHVWRLVGKNGNPFVSGAGHGGAGQRGRSWQRFGTTARCRPYVHLARWPGKCRTIFEEEGRIRSRVSVLDLRREASERRSAEPQ